MLVKMFARHYPVNRTRVKYCKIYCYFFLFLLLYIFFFILFVSKRLRVLFIFLRRQ